MITRRLSLATRNPDKIKEIRVILNLPQFDLVSLLDFPEMDEIVEDGETLKANALKKAREAFQWTQIPSLADDTGLEVDCMNGAPGVRSSRFAGDGASYRDNCEKLLELMQGVPAEKRSARFRCVVAYADSDEEFTVEGICEGVILNAYRGEGGFGYDPLFYLPKIGKTFAEMNTEEKNRISHRGIAFRKMNDRLQEKFFSKITEESQAIQ
jgi:XTP/dITP diphosphohydrolase